MADQGKRESQSGNQGTKPTTDKQNQTGDPGRTPGKAEGSEETVEQSLREKEDKPLH